VEQENTVKKTLWILLALCSPFAPRAIAAKGAHPGDLAAEAYPESQAQVRKRLDEIWTSAAGKDFTKLASFHLYGPKFTEFKDGAPRGNAATNKKVEEEELGMLADPRVDMKDLAINVYGDTAIATFNGDYAAKMEGKPIAMKLATTMVFVKYKGDWKIVHEHFSPIGAPPGPSAK
jgi:ketosteroid isomerase-like protein